MAAAMFEEAGFSSAAAGLLYDLEGTQDLKRRKRAAAVDNTPVLLETGKKHLACNSIRYMF